MKKINQSPTGFNDMPVIIIRDKDGQILEKISINELNRRKQSLEETETQHIKMYRSALDYSANEEYENAEELLLYLLEQPHQGVNYQYYERLANIYRKQKRFKDEIALLEEAKNELLLFGMYEALIAKVERRIDKVIRIENGDLPYLCVE